MGGLLSLITSTTYCRGTLVRPPEYLFSDTFQPLSDYAERFLKAPVFTSNDISDLELKLLTAFLARKDFYGSCSDVEI